MSNNITYISEYKQHGMKHAKAEADMEHPCVLPAYLNRYHKARQLLRDHTDI